MIFPDASLCTITSLVSRVQTHPVHITPKTVANTIFFIFTLPPRPITYSQGQKFRRGTSEKRALRSRTQLSPGFGPVVSVAALGLGDRFQGSTSRFQNADILPKHRHSVNREFLQISKPPRNATPEPQHYCCGATV